MAGERVGQSAVCADAGTSHREGHAGLRTRLASDHSFIHSFCKYLLRACNVPLYILCITLG